MPATDVTIKPTYRKIAIIDDDNAKEIVYPKTVDKLVLIMIILFISIIVFAYLKRKKYLSS